MVRWENLIAATTAPIATSTMVRISFFLPNDTPTYETLATPAEAKDTGARLAPTLESVKQSVPKVSALKTEEEGISRQHTVNKVELKPLLSLC